MNRLKRLLAAPVFEDREKTRIAAWLNVILLTVLGAAILLPVSVAIVHPLPRLTIHLVAGLTAIVSAGLLILLRRGYIQAVGLLLSLALWTSFTIPIYTFDGVRDTAVSGYFFVIILTSLICRRGTVLAFSLASLLAVAGAFFAERGGVIAVSFDPVPPPLDLIVIVLTLSLSTLLLYLAVRSQRAAHQSLHQERNRAQQYLDVAGVMLLALDENGRITLLNRKGYQILGYPEGELLGQNWFQTCLPEHIRDKVWQIFSNLISGRTAPVETFEQPVLTQSGQERIIRWQNALLRDEMGRIVGTLSSGQDITERLKTNREIQKRKTYLEGVLEAAPDAIVTLTPEQHVVEWNAGAEKLFGYTAQEAEGRDLDDLVTNEEIRQEARHLKKQLLKHKQVGPIEAVRYHKDGTAIDVVISGGPILVEDELIGMVAVYTDITARKEAEHALQESQNRLLAVLDGIDAHIYVADMETYEILFMNRPMRQDFGEGLEGQICWQVFRGGTERCPHCTNDKLLDADGNPTGVHLWEGRNPITGRWYANYDRAIPWVDDRMVRLQIATDITARKQVERELEERRVYLEGVLNAAPDAIITLDARHLIVEWNPGAEELFQYTAAEAVGCNLDDLINAPQTVDEAVDLTKKVLDQEPVGPMETVRYRKDGSPVDVTLAGAPIVVGKELIGAVGVYTDITERKLAETALRELNLTLEDEVVAQMRAIRAEKEKTDTILRSVGDAIGVSSPDLKIQYVNDAFTALTGYTKEEAIGQPSNFIMAERLPEADWRALQKALAQGDVWRGEAVFQRKDGRTYEAALTIAPSLDAEGQLEGYISSHHDISRLKDLDRAKNQFITNISHELRTPAANIKLYTHLMQKDESGEKSERYFQVLRRQAERLEKLIEDVVEMTDLDSGPIVTTWETLDLASLVGSRLVHFQSQAQAAGLTLEMKPVPPQLPSVKGEQSRLIQALDKLIENALVFTPGEGRVTLEVGSTQTPEATWATIAVRDTGPGISAEEQKLIFDRFYRGTLAESGHIPGTGLGLSVAQAIMQAHGGRVTVESQEAQGHESSVQGDESYTGMHGSTFTLWLKADELPPDTTHQML